MKFKKIIDLVKKHNTLCLFETKDCQYLSDGYSLYPLYNLPRFTPEGLCAAYDIKPGQYDKMMIRNEQGVPAAYNISDTDENEIPVEPISDVAIQFAGKMLYPYQTSEGIAFIDAKYLAPLSDMDKNYISLFERHTLSGEIYFVVKHGFIFQAIILPVKIISKDFVESIEALYQKCKVALFNAEMSDDTVRLQQSVFEGGEES